VSVSIADPVPVQEGGGALVFVVSRSGDQVPLQVQFATQDGTAKAGTDYQAEAGTLTFAAAQTTATIDVPVLDAGAFQRQRTFSILLSNPLVTAPLSPQSSFPVGKEPFAVAVGDFNGDGKPDLAVADYADGKVGVLLNTTPQGATTPTFAAQQTFAVGNDPHAVAVGDVNGDGKPDLVVANTQDGTVSVLLNLTPKGASTVTFTGQTFTVGHGPQSVVLTDVNGDNLPDVITANFNDNTVSVLLNTTPQDATVAFFSGQQTFPVGKQPFAVAVGDVNGDGKPDIVTANYLDGTVSVLLNTTPQGTSPAAFAGEQSFAAGTSPQSVAVADVNGDGKPDVIAADYGGSVSVLLNTTTKGATVPTFLARQTFAVGNGASAVAAAALNGDNNPDLIIANQLDDTVGVLLNTTPQNATTASFDPQGAVAAGHLPLSVAVGDFNTDQQPDVAVANEGGNTVGVLPGVPASISLARSQATGTLLAAPPPVPPVSPPASVPTSIVLTVPSPVPAAGRPLMLTAQVSGAGAGQVLFLDLFHGVLQVLGVGALDSGSAALTAELAAGQHLVFAFFPGDGLHAPSLSGGRSFVVRRRSAPTVGHPGRVRLGLAALVRGTAGPATGQVVFVDVTGGGRDLGATPLDGDGFANLGVSVGSGGHEFRALYLGDGTHAGEMSETLTVQADTDLAAAVALPLFVLGPIL
jgi:hypothetical protein